MCCTTVRFRTLLVLTPPSPLRVVRAHCPPIAAPPSPTIFTFYSIAKRTSGAFTRPPAQLPRILVMTLKVLFCSLEFPDAAAAGGDSIMWLNSSFSRNKCCGSPLGRKRPCKPLPQPHTCRANNNARSFILSATFSLGLRKSW